MIAIVTVIVLIIFLVLVLAVHLSLGTKKIYNNLNNKHVVITGGSSGIGKAAAVEAAKLGANVTLIGRDVTKLETAANEIRKACLVPEKQEVQYAILDVTAGFEAVQKCFSGLEASVGPIFMLINCAGMCICGEFENMKAEDIKYMIDLNYFGTANPTKYVLPGMKKKNEGLIVFVSTEAALLGIYGFSAYGGAKWAVRGLAETLFMELEGTGVQLTLAFPPDTDTPGFQEEQKTKPKETKLMCESGGLKTAEEVARKMIQDVLQGKKYSAFGFTGQLMTLLNCGSIESVRQVLIQVFTMGFLRAIMVAAILSFNKIARDSVKEKKLIENAKNK